MLLEPTPDRFVMFPIKDDEIWALYKKQVDSFWRAEEVDVSNDLRDWQQLSVDERQFVLKKLGPSTVSKLRWKTFTAKCTRSSLIR